MNAKLFLGRLVCLIVGHAEVRTIEAFLNGKSALKLGSFFVPENNVTFEGEEFRYVVSVFCCARCRLHFLTEGQTIPILNGEGSGGRHGYGRRLLLATETIEECGHGYDSLG